MRPHRLLLFLMALFFGVSLSCWVAWDSRNIPVQGEPVRLEAK